MRTGPEKFNAKKELINSLKSKVDVNKLIGWLEELQQSAGQNVTTGLGKIIVNLKKEARRTDPQVDRPAGGGPAAGPPDVLAKVTLANQALPLSNLLDQFGFKSEEKQKLLFPPTIREGDVFSSEAFLVRILSNTECGAKDKEALFTNYLKHFASYAGRTKDLADRESFFNGIRDFGDLLQFPESLHSFGINKTLTTKYLQIFNDLIPTLNDSINHPDYFLIPVKLEDK